MLKFTQMIAVQIFVTSIVYDLTGTVGGDEAVTIANGFAIKGATDLDAGEESFKT